MIVKNATYEEISHAIKDIQAKYENNISVFIQTTGKRYKVKLSVKNANKKKGSIRGRKLNQSYVANGHQKGIFASNGSACWHVFGDFFDSLLKIQPNAIIVTQYGAIDKNGGNWVDHNRGSIMEPIMYSELCECNQWRNREGLSVEVRTIHQKNLTSECWMVQLQGLTACDACELKDTDDCGGQRIRETLKNSIGSTVPIN